MNLLKTIFLFLIAVSFYACENEVDLNADFTDTTVVYGLLNANVDTQFVKVNRAFLEDGVNAIDLAKETDRLFYDSIDVRLISTEDKDTFLLSTIEKPKDPGIFSTEKNTIFYTTENIKEELPYKLSIIKKDGSETFATTTTLEEPLLVRPAEESRPDLSERRVLSFKNNTGSFIDYEFIFRLSDKVAKISASMYLSYYTSSSQGREFFRVEIPIGTIVNRELENENFSILFPGRRFYETIASSLEPTTEDRVVPTFNCIEIEIYAVDEIYQQYSDINGPLDGIAQVRPEFTNVTNGVGLFTSRSFLFTRSHLEFQSTTTRSELLTGSITGDLGFVNP